jgi:osmotically-inducible protein OsmY
MAIHRQRQMHMKTDDELQQDVLAELAWEPSVNAAQIGVEVKDGVVTLAGHVGSFIEKWEAERAAQRVSGVRGLAVEMDVKLPGSSQRIDADIVRSAENTLQWMTYVPQDSIKVMVERGWITLTGEVVWEYQRKAATDGVRGLMGVTGVSDQISIKRGASSDAVKADIEAALKRRAHTDGQSISVEVHGTDVTLRGRVHSWPERDLVASCAWGSAGVHSVSDYVTVSPF